MTFDFHPVANIFPMMNAQEYMDLKSDIAENGQHEAIYVYQGKIIDGRNRYRACMDLGIEPVIREWDGQGDLVKFVVSLNLHRRHLNESQRGMVAAKLAGMKRGDFFGNQTVSANLQTPSRAAAADMLNVSERTVNTARKVYEQAVPELLERVEWGEVSVSAAAEVATLPEEWQRVIVDTDQVADAAREIRNGKQEAVEERVRPHVANNSGNNEWYTPVEYIDAARAVMGEIDLDPASSDIANETVNAKIYYTAEHSGLVEKWFGRVWMNPPYSSELIGKFSDKLVQHFVNGEVPEAIVLVNNATETAWFQTMLACSAAVCFIRRRVRFIDMEGNPSGAPLQGQAILYMGNNVDLFGSVFGEFGMVLYGRSEGRNS